MKYENRKNIKHVKNYKTWNIKNENYIKIIL